MPTYDIYVLGASHVTVSNGGSLSGITQGDASHLAGQTITLDDNAWQAVAIDDNETLFADNDGNQTLSGAQTLDGIAYADNATVEAEYAVEVTDGTNTYTLIGFNIREPGAGNPFGTIEGLAFIGAFPPVGVPLTVVGTSEGPSNNSGSATSTESVTYATPPCFVSGTLIATPDGPRPVEALRIGDLVSTVDSGPVPVRWAGRVEIGPDRLREAPSLRPVTIRAGAFGPARPERDLHVSQQHRILCDGPSVPLSFGTPEVLVAAAHLVDGQNVVIDESAGSVTYHHLLFDRHEVVLSEGLPTESFLPGPAALGSMPCASLVELLILFPELRRCDGPSPLEAARPILKRYEASVLAA